jgi:FixJ family two-component response regulator
VPAKPLIAPLIAIVEDDESLRPALLALVRSMGYDGVGFPTAEDYLVVDADIGAACLVTDLQLPGIDGLELAARTKLPVILITARTEKAIDARAQEHGVLCLLRKPFEAEDLAGCIRRALDS